MIKAFTLVITSLLLSKLLFSQTPKVSEAQIKDVTIFLVGAELKREANVNLTAGKNKLVFKNQSPFMDPSSVQIGLDKDVKILSVSSELNHLVPETLEPRIKTLKDSIEFLELSIESLNNEIDAYSIEKDVMMTNKKVSGEASGLSVDELKKATEFFRTRVLEIGKAINTLSRKRKLESDLKNKLQRQLNTLNYENNPKRYDIHVLVESKTTTSAKVGIRYLTSQAGWEPVYDIKAQDINSDITIVYKGKVFNNTSISWDDVTMHLSSADPYLSASRPELKPWYLNYTTHSTYRQSAEKVSNYNSSVSNRSADTWDNNQMQKVKYKEVLVSEVSVQFDIEEKYTIPADAKPYIIGISENKLPASYSHFTVPKLEKKAFLMADITGWENLNLIEGPSNIYFGNKYVGKSKINPVEFADTMSISLGRDDKVLIERIEKMEYSSKSILGGSRKESYTYEIKIKNMHSKEIDIEIQDQYPISKNSEINVNVDEISDADKNEETGILSWRLKLAPSKVQNYELGYTIKYPKAKQVVTKTRYRTISAPSF